MLIKAKDSSTKTLVVGADTYPAKAPGVFEVPEDVGRTLTAFSHFNVAKHPLPDYLPDKPVKKARGTSQRKKA